MTQLAPTPTRWHAHPDAAAVQHVVLNLIRQSAAEGIAARGRFDLVLAGGSTPQAIYRECRHLTTDWSRWHIYFGDERCLPPEHADRNSRMAGLAWLNEVGIPDDQIHPMPAELGAIAAAEHYARTLASVGDFDFVLLGLGEDGHTASLFPGHAWGTSPDAPDTLAVFDAPKPPPERVSLSARRLAQTRQLAFVVTGQGKLEAVTAWRAGHAIPAAVVSPQCGVDVFCEKSLLAYA